jgi:hypothetical protein
MKIFTLRGEEEEYLSLARADLSRYLYRPCITCVNLLMLGVVSTLPQLVCLYHGRDKPDPNPG